MALSFVQFTGDGVTTNFAFSFPYLDKSHVVVRVNNIITTYSWVNSSTIQVSPAPLTGLIVDVRRATPITSQQVVFSNGSVENQTDLNNGNLQMLYAEQETSDFKSTAVALVFDGTLDAQGFRVKNLGTPTNLTDGATKAYVDGAFGTAPVAGHSLEAHNDTVVRAQSPGDMLVSDSSQSNKWNGLAVGNNLDTLEVDTSQSMKIRWRSLASKLLQLLTTKGDLLVSTGATTQRKAVGNDGDALYSDSTASDGLSWLAPLLHGQCRLSLVSTTSINLGRWNGRKLLVNSSSAWKLRDIPSAGISAANTSVFVSGVAAQNLAASTVYYVYVFDNAGTLTIDFSVTAYAVDSTSGVVTKNGDVTRTLVGMIRTNASSQFEDSAGLRGILNWFNRTLIVSELGMAADVTSGSTIVIEIDTTLRPRFLVWSGQAVLLRLSGSCSNSSDQAITSAGVSLDSGGVPLCMASMTTSAVNGPECITSTATNFPSEGSHYVSMIGAVNGNTGRWIGTDALGGLGGKLRLSSTTMG